MRRSNPDYVKMLIEKSNERRGWRAATYSGEYVAIPVSDQDYRSYKKSSYLLIFLIAVFCVGAGFLNNQGMFELYVVFPYVLAIFSFAYFVLNLIQMPKKKDKFRFGEAGHLFNRMRFSSGFLGISVSACILGEVFFLSNSSIENRSSLDIVFLSMLAASVFLAIILNRIQNKIAKKSSVEK